MLRDGEEVNPAPNTITRPDAAGLEPNRNKRRHLRCRRGTRGKGPMTTPHFIGIGKSFNPSFCLCPLRSIMNCIAYAFIFGDCFENSFTASV
jgi:hypothetical protein